MSIRFRLKSLCFLLGILLITLIHLVSQMSVPLLAQEHIHEEHYYVPFTELPTLTIQQGTLTTDYPDWRQITFSRLKGIAESGELISDPTWDQALGYGLSRIWNEGDSPAQFLKLGDFQDSLVGEFTLEYILENSLTGINFDEIPLSALELIKSQTISSLVEAIPQLKNLNVKDVKPILALVTSQYANISLDSLLNTPLGNLSFDNLNLEEFSLDSIPFLSETPLSEFQDWQNSFVEQVPGLWDLPFNFIFGDGLFANGLIGIVDVAYGTAETKRDNTITGSYSEGFNVDCEIECAYAELANWSYGKQWISGKYQKVKGGKGLLGLVNGGIEPTGRHPFGSAFKVVVWDTSESEGRVDTALFFRYCQKGLFYDLGCTPYSIGPVPFLSYNEKDTMFVGLLDGFGGGGDPAPIPVPPLEKQPLPPKNASGLINPLPGATVTSGYGYRNIGVKGSSKFHEAVDLAYGTSDPRYPGQIIAAGDGVVTYADRAKGCGTLIKIDHLNGLQTGYCHQSEMYVEQGKQVVQGQVIAKVGNEGNSSAPHLHFMVYENGKKTNPRNYVNF